MDNQEKTILIVDDDREVTEMLSTFVGSMGFRPVKMYDATSTKKWLSENRPDLILLDIVLPDTTGLEFCVWIVSHKNLKGVPIIHITGFMKDDNTRQISEISGASSLVIKPIDLKLLEEQVKTLVGKEKATLALA